jgi:hypothetical protein
VKQCVATEGVEPEYIKTEVLPEFFRCFWQRRMALDRRNYRALVETTVEVANKVGALGAGWACARGGGRGPFLRVAAPIARRPAAWRRATAAPSLCLTPFPPSTLLSLNPPAPRTSSPSTPPLPPRPFSPSTPALP